MREFCQPSVLRASTGARCALEGWAFGIRAAPSDFDPGAVAGGTHFKVDAVLAHAPRELARPFFLFHPFLWGAAPLGRLRGPIARACLFRRFKRRGTVAAGAYLETVAAARARDHFGADAVLAQASRPVDELGFSLLFLGLFPCRRARRRRGAGASACGEQRAGRKRGRRGDGRAEAHERIKTRKAENRLTGSEELHEAQRRTRAAERLPVQG